MLWAIPSHNATFTQVDVWPSHFWMAQLASTHFNNVKYISLTAYYQHITVVVQIRVVHFIYIHQTAANKQIFIKQIFTIQTNLH